MLEEHFGIQFSEEEIVALRQLLTKSCMRLRKKVQHSISLTCVRYRLRPVTLNDAPFIVALRMDPLLNRFVHEVSPLVEDQVVWLERYFLRPDDYYFVVEDADLANLRAQ